MTTPAAIRIRSTDDVLVVAHDHGGSGPPVLFCHATGFHGRYWDPICERLAGEYRCIGIDLRGHGDSTIPTGLDLAWEGMARDVLAVVDHFGFETVHGVGHSMGGCSLILAESMRPGTVDRGWLCEPIVIPDDPELYPQEGPNVLAESSRRRREVFDSRDAAFARYASRPPFEGTDPAALRAYVDHGFADLPDGTVMLKCRGEIEAQVFEHSRTGAFDLLPSIRSHLTISGSGDGAGPANIAPLVAEALPNGTVEFLPELTHFAPLEDPGRVAGCIRAALAGPGDQSQ